MARTDLPLDVQQVFFDFHWDRDKLWAVEAPVEELPLRELEWQLKLPIWQRTPDQEVFDLCPADVLANPKLFPEHWDRVIRADTDKPVLMMMNRLRRWVIMDGYHRLTRAKFDGKQTLRVKRLPRSAIPAIQRSPAIGLSQARPI